MKKQIKFFMNVENEVSENISLNEYCDIISNNVDNIDESCGFQLSIFEENNIDIFNGIVSLNLIKPYYIDREMFIEFINKLPFVLISQQIDEETQLIFIPVPTPDLNTNDENYETRIANYHATCHRLIANYFDQECKISCDNYLGKIDDITYLFQDNDIYI